jgi:hypothetical protein
MPRSNLVIVRAPTAEHHVGWIEDAPDRNWDLILSTYREAPKTSDVPVVLRPGYRWPALYEILSDLGPGLGGYDYIWLAPDDVAIKPQRIDALFAAMAELQLCVAQPSLTADSYFAWPIVLSLMNCRFRRTNFVEAMVPCFRADVLRAAMPMFPTARFGWGMDWIWPQLVEGAPAGIIDAVFVRHWRPLGQELSRKKSDLGETPGEEMARTLSGRNVQKQPRILEVVLSDGRRISDPIAIRRIVAEGMAKLEMGLRPEYRAGFQLGLARIRSQI